MPWLCGLVGFVLSLAANSTFANFSVRLLPRPVLSICALFVSLVALNSLKFSCLWHASQNAQMAASLIAGVGFIYVLVCFGLSYYYFRRALKSPLSALFRVARPGFLGKGSSGLGRGIALALLCTACLVFFFTLVSVLAPLRFVG